MYGITDSRLSETAMSYNKYYQYTFILQSSSRLLAVHNTSLLTTLCQSHRAKMSALQYLFRFVESPVIYEWYKLGGDAFSLPAM